jgi:hypothetical protein
MVVMDLVFSVFSFLVVVSLQWQDNRYSSW